MSTVIVDIEMFRSVLREYFTESFCHDLMADMNDNEVFIGDYNPEDYPSWIPADKTVPEDKDVYEVTAIKSPGSLYREFAYYNSTAKEWRSHFSGTLLNVLAWKPHTELFYLPFI